MTNKINYKQLKIGKHGLPTYDSLMPLVLMVLKDSGTAKSTKDIFKSITFLLDIPTELTSLTYQNSTDNIFKDRVYWAISEANITGMITRISRGVYKINDIGLQLLEKYGLKLDSKITHTLDAYVEYKANLKKVKAGSDSINQNEQITNASDIVENISSSASDYNSEIQTQLLNKVKKEDPSFFELLVSDLLSKMGYKGKNGSAVVTQKSHDGGVDGIINQDALGTSTVYIQAKRYDGHNVQSPEIKTFFGTLESKHANRGVFITTSDFSKEALNLANIFSIVTINGIELTKLMIKYKVGIEVKKSFELYGIDEDYFDYEDL